MSLMAASVTNLMASDVSYEQIIKCEGENLEVSILQSTDDVRSGLIEVKKDERTYRSTTKLKVVEEELRVYDNYFKINYGQTDDDSGESVRLKLRKKKYRVTCQVQSSSESELCRKEAKKAALRGAGDKKQEYFSVYLNKSLGKVELEDLLDGNDSDIFNVRYVVLSADNATQGWLVTSQVSKDKKCEVVSTQSLGSK
jgi:hypothetical protein